jgi:hypothetical protein
MAVGKQYEKYREAYAESQISASSCDETNGRRSNTRAGVYAKTAPVCDPGMSERCKIAPNN